MSSNGKDIKLLTEIRWEKAPRNVKELSDLLLKERLDPNGFVNNLGPGGTGTKELLLCHYLMNGLVFSEGKKDTKDTKETKDALQTRVTNELECFELLLMHGADVSKPNPYRDNETLLHRLCMRIGSGVINTENTLKYFDVLLKHKANVNARDGEGVTPLGLLFIELTNRPFNIDHLEYITHKLLAEGADPRIISNSNASEDFRNKNAINFAEDALNQYSFSEEERKRIQGLLELMQAKARELDTKKRASAGDEKSSLDTPEVRDEALQSSAILSAYNTIKAGASMLTAKISNIFSEPGKDKRKP